MSKSIDIEHDVAKTKILKSSAIRRSRFYEYNQYLHSMMEDERKRIARELHDMLGQELLYVNMDLLSMKEKIPQKYSLIHRRIEKLSKRINISIEVMQKLITELRPGLLDKIGLEAAIEWHVEEIKNRANIDCELSYNCMFIKTDKEQEISIFRIFQEALSNIIRHAKATKIFIKIFEDSRYFVMTIHDNGKGITERQINHPKSFGIIGMRERAACLGGFLKISKNENPGTTVQLNIPITVYKSERDNKNTYRAHY
jgi:signal transduction histidine kinase